MMTTTVRLKWKHPVDTMYQWDQMCARAVEMFGLPGDRFTTRICTEWMDFVFNSNKDALMFAIEHNGEFISEEQLAVEAISARMFAFS